MPPSNAITFQWLERTWTTSEQGPCNSSRIDATPRDPFLQTDLNEADCAADASREANGAVYGERLK